MKFLDQIVLDNSLRNYVIVAIIILLALLLKRIISKYATAIIFKLGKTKWSGMTKQEFDKIIISPLERIVMAIVVILAVGQLNFPRDLLFSIHKVTSHDIVESIASIIIIVCIVSLVIRFMDFLVLVIEHKSRQEAGRGHLQLLFFFKDLIRVVIIIFGIIFMLKYSFNVDIGNLLTGLSIVGAALALAGRESLENLIASFIIFFDKPFETGNFIKLKDVSGTVERIGLRSTRVRTASKSLITIPNKQMVDSILDNLSERYMIQNELKSFLSPDTSSENLQKAVKGIINILDNKKDKILSHEVFLKEVNNISATVSVIYYTRKDLSLSESNELTQQINIDIRKMQEEYGIAPADSYNLNIKNADTSK